MLCLEVNQLWPPRKGLCIRDLVRKPVLHGCVLDTNIVSDGLYRQTSDELG